MSSVQENLLSVQNKISKIANRCGRDPSKITLIAVSKKKSAQKIIQCIEAGGSHLGENYIQEATQKIDEIGRTRATWHFIGHLQSNKARFAVNYFDFIHTVDSLKLAKEINKQARKINKVQTILLQVNISDESTKSGTSARDTIQLCEQVRLLENISVRGLMCMPPFFTDPELARPYFRQLADLKEEIRGCGFPGVSMTHLSMGMSNDFPVAIEEGATLVRVGTAIFGRRE